jgi:branched-subunit amino acid ABC-type transport system permease component
MAPSDLLIQVLSGLSYGMLLFLVASGLTLVFGVLRVANFAHGSLYMLAAFVTYTVALRVGGGNAGFLAALIVTPIVIAAVGAVIEVLLLRRIVTRPHQYQLILTYGLTLVFADLVRLIWGSEFRSVPRPPMLSGAVDLFGRPFPTYYLAIIVVGVLIAGGLWLLLNATRFGKTVKAIVNDREMVGALGINVPAVCTIVFAGSAWLAGLGGALVAPVGSVALQMDISIIVEAFAVVIIGGVGDVRGALIGAILIGLLHSLGILVAPRMAIAFTFIALCLVLLIRPSGIMGTRA